MIPDAIEVRLKPKERAELESFHETEKTVGHVVELLESHNSRFAAFDPLDGYRARGEEDATSWKTV